jgi:hypothetical protein
MYRVNEGRIWARAHRIWEREGRPDGRSAKHWEMARRELAVEDNQNRKTDPVAGGQIYADGSDDADERTDLSRPSHQGDYEAHSLARRQRERSASANR